MPEIYYKFIVLLFLALSGITRGFYEHKYAKQELLKTYLLNRERFFVKAVGLCIVTPVLFYLFTDWIDFARFELPTVIRVIACALLIMNYFYFVWIHLTLGKNWSPILAISKDQTLITHGPYKFIRHPMYLSIIIHVMLMPFVTANWLLGGIGMASFIVVYLLRVKPEEAMMTEAFGDEYTQYMKKTRRLFPKLF